MTNSPKVQKPFESWIAKRREVSPPATLADQVMVQVADLERQRRGIWWLRLVQQIECTRVARWSVCGGALAIGGAPFFFLAYVAEFFTF